MHEVKLSLTCLWPFCLMATIIDSFFCVLLDVGMVGNQSMETLIRKRLRLGESEQPRQEQVSRAFSKTSVIRILGKEQTSVGLGKIWNCRELPLFEPGDLFNRLNSLTFVHGCSVSGYHLWLLLMSLLWGCCWSVLLLSPPSGCFVESIVAESKDAACGTALLFLLVAICCNQTDFFRLVHSSCRFFVVAHATSRPGQPAVSLCQATWGAPLLRCHTHKAAWRSKKRTSRNVHSTCMRWSQLKLWQEGL